MPQPSPVAIFVDFENIYYCLCATWDRTSADDVAVDMLRRLKKYLLDEYSEQAISLDAYADFERIEENVQGALYLVGFDTHNVLGTDHKNAADMKLCVDAVATMYTRPEIGTFVFVAGDRDYIPVIRHLKKHGRIVRVAGFRKSVSGDLLTNVGQEFFIDAEQFIPRARPQQSAAEPVSVAQESLGLENQALQILLKYFADKPEVWLTPYLHKLRAEMPHLSEWERKDLITALAGDGAFSIEKRSGETHDYSVLLVNWNHPRVRSAAGANT